MGNAESASALRDKASRKAVAIRNGHLVLVWCTIAFICYQLHALLLDQIGLGFVPMALGGYALFCAAMNIPGVVVRDASVSIPLPLTQEFPFLIAGRTRIPMTAILDVRTLGVCLDYESVGLTTKEGQVRVIFSDRDKRLAFFNVMKARNPSLKIYRILHTL